MSETEFDIVEVEDTHAYLQIFAEQAGIQVMAEVDRDDIEALRGALPDKPPDNSDNGE